MGVTRSQGGSSHQAAHCTRQDRNPASSSGPYLWPGPPPTRRLALTPLNSGSGVWQAVKWILRTLCLRYSYLSWSPPETVPLLQCHSAKPNILPQLRASPAGPRVPEPHPGSPAYQPLWQRVVSVLHAGKRALRVGLCDSDVCACVPALLEQWQMPRSPDESRGLHAGCQTPAPVLGPLSPGLVGEGREPLLLFLGSSQFAQKFPHRAKLLSVLYSSAFLRESGK